MAMSAAWGCGRVAPAPADRAPASAAAVFERNQGEAPAAYAYLARRVEHEFAFARDSVRIALTGAAGFASGAQDAKAQLIDLRFDGGYASQPIAEHPLDVQTCERLRYSNVYDGIDAVFYASGPRVEYDLIVQPHADPSAITIRFDGATRVRIDNGGDLVVEAGDSTFVQRKPTAYQTRGGTRTSIRASYRLAGERVGLQLGTYDPREPLVID
jgi:hypothetical protein